MKITTKQALHDTFFNNRMKGLYWSTGMMLLAALLNQISFAVAHYGLSTPWWVFLGLVLAQVSKLISNCLTEKPPLPVNQ